MNSRGFHLRHEFVSPGDMQIFASGEAKICHPFGNFNPSRKRARPFVVWLSTPHPGLAHEPGPLCGQVHVAYATSTCPRFKSAIRGL
jgi:hypothetical protein